MQNQNIKLIIVFAESAYTLVFKKAQKNIYIISLSKIRATVKIITCFILAMVRNLPSTRNSLQNHSID